MKKYDIHERIFTFVIAVIRLLDKLPKTSTNIIVINQVTRSVTSMGANDQEADGALTNKDFIHGFTLVRKEGKETIFWLRVLLETNEKYYAQLIPLIEEGSEIVAIISTIIKKTLENRKE